MQTSEAVLLKTKFDGMVRTPTTMLVELIKAGHLEAASVLAQGVVLQMEKFAEELEKLSPTQTVLNGGLATEDRPSGTFEAVQRAEAAR